MGQYFKTDKATYVDDTIYEAPYELMQKTLDSHDKEFEEAEDSLDIIGELEGELEYLDIDAETKRGLIDKYRDASSKIAKGMNGNISSYQSFLPQVRKLTRDFKNDLQNGTLHKIGRAYKRDKELQARLREDVKAKRISQEQMDRAVNESRRNYGGAGVNEYQEHIDVADVVDEEAFIKNIKATMHENSSIWHEKKSNGRGYFIENSGKRKWIAESDLTNVIESSGDFKKWNEERQQTMLRRFNDGVYTSRKEMNQAYADEKRNFIKTTVGRLAFKDEEDKYSESVDGNWLGAMNHNIARQRLAMAKEKHQTDYAATNEEVEYEQTDEIKNKEIAEAYIKNKKNIPGNGILRKQPTASNRTLESDMAEISSNASLSGVSTEHIVDTFLSGGANAGKLAQKLGTSVDNLRLYAASKNNTVKISNLRSYIGGGNNEQANINFRNNVGNLMRDNSQAPLLSYEIRDESGSVIKRVFGVNADNISSATLDNGKPLFGKTSVRVAGGYKSKVFDGVQMYVDDAGSPVSVGSSDVPKKGFVPNPSYRERKNGKSMGGAKYIQPATLSYVKSRGIGYDKNLVTTEVRQEKFTFNNKDLYQSERNLIPLQGGQKVKNVRNYAVDKYITVDGKKYTLAVKMNAKNFVEGRTKDTARNKGK